LLVALERHLVNVIRYEGRQIRGGKANIINFDHSDLSNPDAIKSAQTPDQAFYYAWITDLLDHVLAEIKGEYCSSQRKSHWEIFRLRLLEPLLHGVDSPSVSSLCEQYGIDNEKKAFNMIETVKRRFRSILMRRLEDLTGSVVEAEQEFCDIFEFLSRYGAE
jgi:hypothetical protein